MKRIGQVEASQIYAGPAPHIFACERRVQRPQGFRDSLRKLLAKLHTQLIFIMVSASRALSKTTRFSACLQPTAKQPLSSSSPHRTTSDGPIDLQRGRFGPRWVQIQHHHIDHEDDIGSKFTGKSAGSMQGSQPSLDAPVHGLETTQRRSSWYGHSKSRTETQSQAEASNCRSLQDNHQARQPRSTPVRSSSCSSSRSSSRSSSQSQIPRTNSIDQCGNADCLTTQGRSRRPYPADRTRHSRLFHSTSQLRTSFRSSSTNRGPFLDSVMGSHNCQCSLLPLYLHFFKIFSPRAAELSRFADGSTGVGRLFLGVGEGKERDKNVN